MPTPDDQVPVASAPPPEPEPVPDEPDPLPNLGDEMTIIIGRMGWL